MTKTAALILAAGRGTRIGGTVPKQYRRIGGVAMLRRTIEVFAGHPWVDAVRAVIHPDDGALYEQATQGLDILPPVPGGAERQESSLRGLESLEQLAPGKVLIHDAARPFTDTGTIDRVIVALDNVPAAIAAVPVSDTIKRASDDGTVADTVERAGLWSAQTPQGFRFADILAAHRKTDNGALTPNTLTDDAAVAEAAGLDVALVEGSEDNFKVTTESDFVRAEALTGGGETRVGQGFDVHRFGPGDHVMLCGVRVPHDRGLQGHSDADVALHALTDAILGAIGAGDIGVHFPPSEAEWRDAESARFLTHAAHLVAERGGAIGHLDLTLICEAPRLGPHREAMVERVAAILEISPDRVSIKATTTERLGFTGRGEGIAAQAVATIRL
ncbi:MAG: bifunctional 2-C-methyl-D-erythritol 4-phosphate cytidylyltransferase/2-C-methyl-D-erythritol 2,4-cyclodiphosphate synthase [Alphaproteobacteria bacterium]|nr:bifunctional 2-C-methyl-D-erythritol 4-phosphate cytidylyltransferase/2-C-methyl-D-erythritol 2,4-cyclodiphosphate synthase [Alphaproteobacteria bacterium]